MGDNAVDLVVRTDDLSSFPVNKRVVQEEDQRTSINELTLDKASDDSKPVLIMEDPIRVQSASSTAAPTKTPRGTKRKRLPSTGNIPESQIPPSDPKSLETTPFSNALETQLEASIAEATSQKRNFHKVIFGQWQMKTWYHAPYPLGHDDHTASGALRVLNSTGPPVSKSSRSSTEPSNGASASRGAPLHDEEATLWVCDKCFKYMKEGVSWEVHVKSCKTLHPPGRKVYQRGAHTIWEVDGAVEKLFCQNLSLFGKFFIDVKTLFFDCENFLFYVLTDADSKRDHVLGFFSKEKVSYDDYNLACIIVLPPYQKKGYGMLLIEFSYEISRRAQKFGTPERPLSELGLRSYLTYWTAVLVRFFRKVLNGTSADDTTAPEPNDISATPARKKKHVKGWAGEVPTSGNPVNGTVVSFLDDAAQSFGSLRTTHTSISLSGEAVTHLSVRCTLADIAKATNLRPEDAAFAMRECGFLRMVKTAPALSNSASKDGNRDGSGRATRRRGAQETEGEVREVIVVTKDMVEALAAERNVKRMFLDVRHVML